LSSGAIQRATADREHVEKRALGERGRLPDLLEQRCAELRLGEFVPVPLNRLPTFNLEPAASPQRHIQLLLTVGAVVMPRMTVRVRGKIDRLHAEHDHHLVGSLVVAWDRWRGNMYHFAVLPSHRRRGIARRLVEAGHEHLPARDTQRVTALVAHAEEDAVELWLSAGYERDEQISRFVRNL
jgi:ribosomal protein S18 acetylase RimI-like enzyme